MREVNRRYKKVTTDLFFDSFKHFKHNLSNLIGVELPTLYKIGAERYLNLIPTNYKSKYPDMRKIGLIEYDKPNDFIFKLTPEAKSFMKNPLLEQNIYSKSDLRIGRKNIDSLSSTSLIELFHNDLNTYKPEILRLILSYYDTADLIRPYLALLNFIKYLNIKILEKDILQSILAHTKEDILSMRYKKETFNNLDPNIQKEIRRPISYIYNFLQTALVLDSAYQVIVDFNLIDRLQTEMNSIVFYEPIQNNSRPAREQRLFRENVLRAYGCHCAITGTSIYIDDRVLLEAAHIIPYRDGGSFAISNGIALSYEMHKMFDNGLFGFFYDESQNLRVKISRSNRIIDKYNMLERLDNHIVNLPFKDSEKPDSLAVEYNLEKYLLN